VIDTKIDTNAKSPDTAASDANKKNEKTKEDVQSAKVDAANADLSKPKEAAQAPTDLKNIIVTPGSQPPPGSGTTKDPVASPEITRQQLLDLMTHLTARSNKCLAVAQNKAKELKSPEVDSEHLLAGLLTDSGVLKILTEMKVDIKKVEQDLTAVYKRGEQATNPQLSARLKRLLDVSLKSARSIGLEFIAPEHLLLGLFEDGEAVGARTLANNGLTKEELTKKIMGDQAKKTDPNDPNAPTAAKEEQPKSALAQFTIDMTAKAQRGELDPVVERSEEIERVMHVLSRRTKNNPALVGEPGVGKTAVVEGLAQRIASGQVPEPLMGKKVLELDLMGILAGASHRGEFEQRMKDLIDEVVNSHGGIILFIDEMHTIVGAGGSGDGSSDAANFLKPALARGDLQVIGATTITEYRKYIEKDPALERRFQTVTVDEPTEEAAIKMLTALAPKYAEYHKVQIPPVAIEAAVKLSKRYVGDRFLPDKAIDLIDEAASSIRLPMISLPEDINSLESRISDLKTQVSTAEQNGDTVKAKGIATKIAELEPIIEEKRQLLAKKQGQSTVDVTEESIKEVVSRWTGIPLAKLSGSESEKLTQLEKIMHQRMIGQERPVKAVAAAVRRGRAGLKSNKRPIGSFIFLGPSGVGKTELTKTLAEILFGQEESMIRFDMTEFMEKHEVAKLLGPPPGYVGYEEGGKLTEAVRRKPYSVVLFDEIEKAHPDIFNILLQVLDDGRLTDNKGRTISFKNTVVICTSNIGTQLIQDHLLEKAKQSKDQKEDDEIEIETEAGAQSEKEVPFPDDPSREYTDMHMDAIDPAYKNAKQNLEVPELPSGFRYEDEVTKGMSSDEYAELKSLVMGELRKFFRPELINRFDEVIVFEPLQLSHMKKIVDLQIKQLMKVLAEQNLAINLSDEAKEHIVLEGFDPVYGARPLRRAIQQILENPISEMIIAQKVKEGDTIHTNFVDEDFVFTTLTEI
jgi:ATP-dependent Clp protease ATP-binding subunit ClpC